MNSLIDRLNDALSDRYRIERELGEGGMATVYLARDERQDRQVAIKVLRYVEGETLRERLDRSSSSPWTKPWGSRGMWRTRWTTRTARG